jgi:hypothetical protein
MSATAEPVGGRYRLKDTERDRDQVVGSVIGVFIFALFLLVASLMCWSVYIQVKLITTATAVALTHPNTDHAAALGYSRALNTAVVKTSCIFLAYLLIFLGGLYVLRTAKQTFGLDIEAKGVKGTLNTSSPGLVMAALGAALVLGALFHEPRLDYTPNTQTMTSPVYTDSPSTNYAKPPQ